jgi:hypothetical protein
MPRLEEKMVNQCIKNRNEDSIMTNAESDKTKIAIINNNIGFIQKDILEIKLSLRDSFATKEQLVQIAKDTEIRLTKLETSGNLWRVLNPILASVFGSLLTFLLIQYLQNIR